ncbi:lysophospholipid acyltransferase family protein [Phosphitispora fastidiosa]|uniref:lysophospholipid acyltransferase family protein n=1 Tax=Phosphitispora fastidiosa TaxID=2837202 RepID=UPI001E5EE39E|nr:lysophospholipid acyltransferase family protein [Phosphitispora fastidiosa]MBU7006854.1 1-acyl-sn-glycerol-3-phosphate acyltransferase [Phosphitispora fastidiosa]
MLRTVWFYMILVLSVLATTIALPVWHVFGLLGMKDAQHKCGHYVAYYWGRILLSAAAVKVEIQGLENVPAEGSVVFVGNHQSNFDIFVLLGCINKSKSFLAKVELAKIPIVHSWMQKMKCVFIDRGNMRQSIKAIQRCIEVIKEGQSMVIFPEGTRSKGPDMGEFKKGSLRVAEKSGAPVVPVAISGTYRIMEANNGRISPVAVTVKIAPPIIYDSLSKEEQGNIHTILRDTIAENVSDK